MNIFNNFRKFFTTIGNIDFGYLFQGGNLTDAQTKDFYDSYKTSYIVSACLDAIQTNTANMEPKLYKAQKNKKVKEVYSHEILDLLYKVNPFTTFRQQISLTQLCLDLIGSAYWLKVRDKRGQVIELWLLRPDLVMPKAENGEYISYYEYTGRGITERFDINDVVPFLNPNPVDARLGQSKIQPEIDLIRSQVFSTKWNMNFFYKEARPDAIMNIKGRKPLTKEDKTEIYKDWDSKFGGYQKAHNFSILQGDVDYKILSNTQKDMDFVNLDSSMAQNIMTGLRVPKPVLCPDIGNKSTVDGAIYIFMSQVIEPNQKKIIDTLNEFLVGDFDYTLFLDIESPVPEDEELKAKIYAEYVDKGIMTRNEVREKLGLPKLDGGDDVLVPVILVPLGSGMNIPEEGEEDKKVMRSFKVSAKALDEIEERKYYKSIRGKSKYFKEEEQKNETIERIAKAVMEKIQVSKTVQKKVVKYTPEMKQVIWENFNKGFGATEKKFEEMFKKLERDQQIRIETYLFKSRKAKDYILKKDLSDSIDKYDWKKEVEIFIDIALPLHTETIVQAGKDAASRVGSTFTINEEVRVYIKKKTMKFATEVNETTKENLKNTLSQGIEEGESLEDLRKRVEHTFEVRQGAGARAVASTETLASVNGGWLEAYKQSKVVNKKEWYHAGSSKNDRPEHIAISGEERGLDDKFSIGLMFPGDPDASPDQTTNCKCIILEVIED